MRILPSLARACTGALAAALAAAPAAARHQEPGVPLTPAPVVRGEPMSEAELLPLLPDRERGMIAGRAEPRERFEMLLDVSDLLLTGLNHQVDAEGTSLARSLLLYEAVVYAANARLRSPEANVRPRDKRYKQFERRLQRQLGLLKSIVADLPPTDMDVGTAVADTVHRLRVDALNSALDTEILTGN